MIGKWLYKIANILFLYPTLIREPIFHHFIQNNTENSSFGGSQNTLFLSVQIVLLLKKMYMKYYELQIEKSTFA